MSKRRGVKITTSPVSDAYSDRDEKRIEFSAVRRDVLEDGSYNSLMGGLVSFTVIRAQGPDTDVPEDKLIVNVYRTDPNVEVRWQGQPSPASTGRLTREARELLDDPHSRYADDPAVPLAERDPALAEAVTEPNED